MAITDTTSPILLSLDHNRQIPVTLTPAAGDQAGYDLQIDCRQVDSKRFVRQLEQGIGFRAHGIVFTPRPGELHISPSPVHLSWRIPTEPLSEAEILLFGEPVCAIELQQAPASLELDAIEKGELPPAGGFVLAKGRAHERLTLSEIKSLSNADVPLQGIPYPRAAMAGFDPAIHAPITDLHTHSTAQIKAEDLMEIALGQDRRMAEPGITYPLELLALLGMPLSEAQKRQVVTVPSIKFSPGLKEDVQLHCEQDPKNGNTCQAIRLKDLTRAQHEIIIRKIGIPQQTIQPFSRFDPEMYRFRNPLAKRSELSREMILTIARDYAEQGIRYTELSTGSMLENPPWFAEAITAVEEAQQRHGVTVRFLAGIPRSNDAASMLRDLEKIKYAARHPYIVGVDVLGYEFNSTKEFAWALEHIAQWASVSENTELQVIHGWDFSRDFTIRVHAGETGKRRENVIECAKIARQYGVKVRIAHALSGKKLTAPEKALIQEQVAAGRLMVELCPASNLTYNNLARIDRAPLQEWQGIGAPVALGTDGGGAIQSDATQLALDALAAGWTLADLTAMRAMEEHFIARQQRDEATKRAAYHTHYGAHADAPFIHAYTQRLKEISAHTIDMEFDGRVSFLVAGAGGTTYDNFLPAEQFARERAAVSVAFEMLRMACRREMNGIILGRVKEEGVSGEMDQALMHHRKANPSYAFPVAGIYAEGTTEIARSLTYCESIPGEESSIPFNLFQRATRLHPPALGIFVSGSNFTNDLLRFYHDDSTYEGGWPFVVMSNTPGASQDFADVTEPHRHFTDGISLLKAIDHQVRYTDAGRAIFGDVLPFASELYHTNAEGDIALDSQKLEEMQVAAKRSVEAR